MPFGLDNIRNTEIKSLVRSTCLPLLKIQSRIQKLVTKNISEKYNPLHTNLLTLRCTQPIGITNHSRNCWCISALQLLCNTPIHSKMVNSTKFSKDFPAITKSIKLYHKASTSPELLGDRIQHIRKELYQKLSHNFKEKESEPADATEFLNLLLGKYTFGQELSLSHSSTNLTALLCTSKEKYLFIETTALPPELNLQELFNTTPYELLGLIFYLPSTKHYIASVKVKGEWYKCNDGAISRVNSTDLPLRENIVLMMASRRKSS